MVSEINKALLNAVLKRLIMMERLIGKNPSAVIFFLSELTETKEYIMVNYEPREGLCSPGCALGKKVKLPVYQFLKESLIRKFGEHFISLTPDCIDYFEAKQSSKRK